MQQHIYSRKDNVGRIASGVKLMDVDSENVSVASIAKVRQGDEEEEEASESVEKSEEQTEE